MPEGSGYMSDDTSSRSVSRGPRKSLNKALRQLHFLKVCSGFTVLRHFNAATPVMGACAPPLSYPCLYRARSVQQRNSNAAGPRWFNPEELTAQKVRLASWPFISRCVFNISGTCRVCCGQ